MVRPLFPYERLQLQRFMRPDSHRWFRPDASRYCKPSRKITPVRAPLAFKYSPDQPRDELGRWESGAGQDSSAADSEDINDTTLVQDILAEAEKLMLSGSPADYRKCLGLNR